MACRRNCGRSLWFPRLLTTRSAVDEQIERMEVHYLANQDGDLYFALLSDWVDSATQSAPD